ncbi:MAG TPA: DHA2 family efflux MFS transporter permease subunit [Capillimicrobium sp.]|jgi:EmrB/QacA subfamily drug resistance transporter
MPTPTERPARVNPPPEELQARRWRIFGVMMIAWAMSMLDASIVNISIPTLQRDLDADVGDASWVVTAYNLAFAVLLVPMGRLADQFGRRRLFVIGLAVFTLGSALCAIAPSIEALIGFRVLQGAGAGILAPLGFAIAVLVFPPHQRGFGLSLIAIVALVSNASGPVIGGLLVDLAGWEWIFLVNLPFGVLGVVLALRWWPETWDLTAGRRVDWLGMALLAGAVASLVFALVEGGERGWTSPLILFLAQLAILLGAGFAASQRFGRHPMITRELAGNRQYVGANTAMLLFAAGYIGSLLLLSLVLVNLWGFSPLEAAGLLTPLPLCGLLAWPVVARAADSRAPRELAVPALAMVGVGLLWVSFLPSVADSAFDYLLILPGLLLMGAGMGTVFPTVNVGAMGAVQGPQVGLASGVLNTSRQLGTTLGVALLVAVFVAVASPALSSTRDRVEDRARDLVIPAAVLDGMIREDFSDFSGASGERGDPPPGFDARVARETAGAARDSYSWAFRVAALLMFLAIPFARRMEHAPGRGGPPRQPEPRPEAARSEPEPPETVVVSSLR